MAPGLLPRILSVSRAGGTPPHGNKGGTPAYDASWVLFSPAWQPTPWRRFGAMPSLATGVLNSTVSLFSLAMKTRLPNLSDALYTTQISLCCLMVLVRCVLR